MKGILIKESNKEKINTYIAEAEGRANVRTVDYITIINDIKTLEKKLSINKKDMTGITADIDHHAQNFPSAYKYRPESTHYVIIKEKTGWKLLVALRCTTRRDGKTFRLTLPDDAKTAIIKSMSEF